MKIGKTRSLSHYFHLLIGMIVLAPQGFISLAFAQDAAAGGKSFGAQMVDSLGIFLYAFILMVLGGISLIIYNGIAIRKKAFVKDEVVEPILAEVGRLNIDGARELCDQFKMPATNVLKAGLDRIQDDELDTDSIEKGPSGAVKSAHPKVTLGTTLHGRYYRSKRLKTANRTEKQLMCIGEYEHGWWAILQGLRCECVPSCSVPWLMLVGRVSP